MFMLKVAELFWKMDTNINTEESSACVRALLRLGADFFFFSFRQAGPNPQRAQKRAETQCDLYLW